MVSLEQIQASFAASPTHGIEYQCRANLNLYDSSNCSSLATQAAIHRHLRVVSPTPIEQAITVRLCEDGYSGWLHLEDLIEIEPATTVYEAIALSSAEIQTRLPGVIEFTYDAMQDPNYYLWGGTVAPNYDCSGLMQAAFASVGIWLPRDSYQQQAFTQAIALEELQLGDLVFFGTPEKVNHVGLYLENQCYIHSSGKQTGRNGIGINLLTDEDDEISRFYYQHFWGGGRVVASYQPPMVD
jgi:hypothetical protein